MVDLPSGQDHSSGPSPDELSRRVRGDQLLSVQRSVRAVVPSGMAVGCVTAGVALYASVHWVGPAAWLMLVVLSNTYRAYVLSLIHI